MDTNVKVLRRPGDGSKLIVSTSQAIYAVVGAMVGIFLLGSGAVLFINEVTVNPAAMEVVQKEVEKVKAEGQRELKEAEARFVERHTEAITEHDKIRREFIDVVKDLRAEARADREQVNAKFDRIMERLPPRQTRVGGVTRDLAHVPGS